MRSPCFDCGLKHADKNCYQCLKCEARCRYIAALDNGEMYNVSGENLKSCIKKKEGDMPKKGTCVNCERTNKTLPAFGRCDLCYKAANKIEKAGGSVGEVAAALAEVKRRIQSGESLRSRLGKKKSAKAAGEPASIKKVVERIEGVLPIADLSARAEKAMELKRLFDATFKPDDERYLKIAIMAAVFDAYRNGFCDGRA